MYFHYIITSMNYYLFFTSKICPTTIDPKNMKVKSAVPFIDLFEKNNPTIAWDENAVRAPISKASLPR